MPRTFQNGLKEFHASGRGAGIAYYITLFLPEYPGNPLLPAGGLVFNLCSSSENGASSATPGMTINGAFYETHLKSVGDITRTVDRATERVEVVIQNVTTVFGPKLLRDVNVLHGATATIGRWWQDVESKQVYSEDWFTGVVDGASGDERSVRLEVLSDMYTARALRGRPVSPNCSLIHNSPGIQLRAPHLGLACGDTSGRTSCAHTYTGDNGCTVQHRYGGFVQLEGVHAVSGASDLAIPTRTLIYDGATPMPMRQKTVYEGFTFADNATDDQTEISTPREKLVGARTLYVRVNLGTCTITNASPGVVTKTAHGLSADDPVVFSTTGTLPTGLTPGTVYYARSIAANTFEVSATPGGASINTSSAGSGTHSVATGNNSNDGLAQTRAGAYLTIQTAINKINNDYDLGGQTVTVQVADGTYTNETILKPLVGIGIVNIFGNITTPANVLINVTGGKCFYTSTFQYITGYVIRGFKLQTSGAGHPCVYLDNNAAIQMGNIDFGISAGTGTAPGRESHCFITTKSYLRFIAPYTISNHAFYHYQCIDQSLIQNIFNTITLSGTPAFSVFAFFDRQSELWISSLTKVGSATGSRYSVNHGSLIYTGSPDLTYLPGDSAGSTSTGGMYD